MLHENFTGDVSLGKVKSRQILEVMLIRNRTFLFPVGLCQLDIGLFLTDIWLTDWLRTTDWLIDWLIDSWLVGWLTRDSLNTHPHALSLHDKLYVNVSFTTFCEILSIPRVYFVVTA